MKGKRVTEGREGERERERERGEREEKVIRPLEGSWKFFCLLKFFVCCRACCGLRERDLSHGEVRVFRSSSG